jgi:hypothetical protein
MTDVIVTPTSAEPPPQEPAIEREMHELSKYDAVNELARAIPGDMPGSDLSADEAFELTKKRREQTGFDPWAEQNAPLVERKYGDDADLSGLSKEKALRKVTEDLTFSRAMEGAHDRMMAGATVDEAVQQHFADKVAPPDQLGVWNPKTGLREPKLDNERYTEADRLSIEDATKELKNFRAVREVQQQALLNELQAREAAELQQTLAAAAEQEMAQAQPQAQQPQEQAQPAQQEPDPVAIERARLAQQQAQLSWSNVERQAAGQIQTWNNAFAKAYPESNNPAALAELRQRNPQRFAAMQADAQKALNAVNGWTNHFRAAQSQRLAHERQLAELQQAHNRVAWHSYKQAEDAKFAPYLPDLTDPKKATEIKLGVRKMLNDVGFGEDEITAAWNGETGYSLRDHRSQRVLYDAFQWRQAQARAKQFNEHKRPLPPVAPGFSEPRGAVDERALGELMRQDIEGMPVEKALRHAARIQAARRGRR